MTADLAETFTEHRPLLFSIAYRMLGTVMDAEDAVQETYLRWQQAPRDDVASPRSYLATVVTRLCIDELKSAKTKREQYIGPWLPEPIVTEDQPDMADNLALADSLSVAFLVLLESLSPTERAVFLLRDVFDYDYAEVAEIIGKSEANCRQMLHRAREKVAKRPQRFDVTREQISELAERFFRASAEGDMDELLSLLTDDVTVWSDGGGKTAAALNPVYGPDKVARLFVGLMRKAPEGVSWRMAQVNGLPGVVAYIGTQPFSVFSFEVEDGRVREMRIVVNPEKLTRVPSLN